MRCIERRRARKADESGTDTEGSTTEEAHGRFIDGWRPFGCCTCGALLCGQIVTAREGNALCSSCPLTH
eukprot:4284113-Prymnesium_polylepis.1